MLTEYTRVLGQRQRTLSTHNIRNSKIISIFLCQVLKPQFPQGHMKRAMWHILQERNPELRETKYFITGSKQVVLWCRTRLSMSFKAVSKPALCSRGNLYLYLLKLFTIQTSLKKQSGIISVSISAHNMSGNVKDVCERPTSPNNMHPSFLYLFLYYLGFCWIFLLQQPLWQICVKIIWLI